jgi:hypothetical protein
MWDLIGAASLSLAYHAALAQQAVGAEADKEADCSGSREAAAFLSARLVRPGCRNSGTLFALFPKQDEVIHSTGNDP